MCDICKSERLDSRFINGDKYRLYTRRIYTVFRGKTVNIKLCFIHDLEFFTYGETKFVEYYPKLVKTVLNGRSKVDKYDPFSEELKNISQLI